MHTGFKFPLKLFVPSFPSLFADSEDFQPSMLSVVPSYLLTMSALSLQCLLALVRHVSRHNWQRGSDSLRSPWWQTTSAYQHRKMLSSSTLGSGDNIVSSWATSFNAKPSLNGKLSVELVGKKYWDVKLFPVRHHGDVDMEETHSRECGEGTASADPFHPGE